MRFQVLCWAALFFQYSSRNDSRYLAIMKDKDFISTLRNHPYAVNVKEFEKKVILDYIMVSNFDLLFKNELSENILRVIIELESEFDYFKNLTILDLNLSDEDAQEKLINIFCRFQKIRGLQLLGVSKILHLMNDRLFSIMTTDYTDQYCELEYSFRPIKWLKQIQLDAVEVVNDFKVQNLSGTIEKYLSSKLGYSHQGIEKSLIKYIDEYYWIRVIDKLDLPPSWMPLYEQSLEKTDALES